MKKQTLIDIKNVSVKIDGLELLNDITLSIKEGELLTIIGKSGSGKSLLGKLISGLLPISSGHYKNLVDEKKRILVPQQYNFGHLTTARISYFSKRYETTETNLYPSVISILSKISDSEEKLQQVAKDLQIATILDSRLIQLSNGECKKVQLAGSILSNPKLLILDNPFVGLDNNTRNAFHKILTNMVSRKIAVVLITTPDEIPETTTRIVELENRTIKQSCPANKFKSKASEKSKKQHFRLNVEKLKLLSERSVKNFSLAVKMENISVSHGSKTILKNVSWEIRHGEKWALLGKNGAGKSTLLSLITADHPQAYKNNITLFDKKRGSGESIWEIKKRIGFVSPEFHLYFLPKTYLLGINQKSEDFSVNSTSRKGMNCFETIASGIHDQVGFTQKLSHVEMQEVESIMDFFKLKHLAEIPFHHVSLGEQRLILLARTLIKLPDLLVLDEPCQGLDKEQTYRFIETLNKLTSELNLTMIYVSHYQDEIPDCVSKNLFLEKGMVVNALS